MKRLLRNILSIVVFLVTAFAVYEIIKLGVLPSKYLFAIIGAEAVLFILGVVFYNLKHIAFIVIGVLLFIISIVGNATGYYYLSKTNNYIDKSFVKETYTIETKYYVVAKATDEATSLDEVSLEAPIEYYKYSRSIDKALEKLGDRNYIPTDNAYNSMIKVLNDNCYFLISSANYEYLFDSTNLLDINNYKVLYEFTIWKIRS